MTDEHRRASVRQSPGPVVVGTLFVVDDGTAAASTTRTAASDLDLPEDLELSTVVLTDAADAESRNRAVGRARGSYLFILEPGVAPARDWLTASLALLRSDPTLAIAAPAADEPAGADAEGWTIAPPPGALAMRRGAWEAIGGLSRGLGPEAWGLDLAWRSWLAGWRVRVGDQIRVELPERDAPSRADLADIAARCFRDHGRLHVPADGSARNPDPRTRRGCQASRRRPDFEMARLLDRAIRAGSLGELGDVLDAAGIRAPFGSRRRIVVATSDTIAARMAGPAIRAWKIAHTLAAAHDVHLVTTGVCEITSEVLPVEAVDDDRLAEVVDGADIVVFQGLVLARYRCLADSDAVLVVDVYDPMHLEQLEQGREGPEEGGRWAAVSAANEILNDQLRRGDYFLAASTKQIDFWRGQAASVGRINQVLYDEDPALDQRFRRVPFGIEEAAPAPTRTAIRDLPGIDADSEVILWGGGIYNWLDPITLIRAVARLSERRPRLRLYFLGTQHPNPELPAMRKATEARALSDELGLTDRVVFFNDGWVAHDDRVNFLTDADIAVSTHERHIETEYSFRTRILDYLWCGLPIVATEGDSFAPLIRTRELGRVVSAGDVDDLESALDALLDDEAERRRCGDNASRLADEFRWPTVLAPLMEIADHPVRAPDVACPAIDDTWAAGDAPAWRDDLDLARHYLREGGLRFVLRRYWSRLTRLREERRDPTG